MVSQTLYLDQSSFSSIYFRTEGSKKDKEIEDKEKDKEKNKEKIKLCSL